MFSGITIDQAHDQNNASVQRDDGAVSLRTLQHHGIGWYLVLKWQAWLEMIYVSTEEEKKTYFWHHKQKKTCTDGMWMN